MKKILIIHQNMEVGGAETSLLGLLNSFDYSKVSIDIFFYEQKGELYDLIPDQVNILQEIPIYKALVSPVKEAIKDKQLKISILRIFTKFRCYIQDKLYSYGDLGYVLKQFYHYNALPLLPFIQGEYDMAISFNDPHFILGNKVHAKIKMGWFHTDFSGIKYNSKLEEKMWSKCDYAVNVSECCKQAFDEKHPYMKNKSIVIENILSKELVKKRADMFDAESEILQDGSVRLLSVGRFSDAKNFDNVPIICQEILKSGIDVKWYLIGYGSDEELIKHRIIEAGMEKQVIILGKKENPYPYIKACDIYVQPSRYEGKCVAVREAQILGKPVIITNYATSSSQLKDGYDGVIVPMDNEGCARGIVSVIRDEKLQRKLVENERKSDYTNVKEIQKLYQLMQDNTLGERSNAVC